MAHNIDMTGGKANMAFMGARQNIWHRLGTQMEAGMSIQQWATAAGLDWTAETGDAWMTGKNGEVVKVDGYKHLYRSDNGAELGYVTNVYKPVQPWQVLEYFGDYISADDRFKLDVAGSLRGGKVIWATATFNGDMTVANDRHVARLLMSTSFDQTYATDNRATMTRVVCNNTLDGALSSGGKSAVRTRHSSKWSAQKVGNKLGNVIQQFAGYKAMGDAMLKFHMPKDKTEGFLKSVLGIKDGAEVSTRLANQLNDMLMAYEATVREGTEPNTAWTALNAVTRYVDHERGTRDTGYGETESRFFSAQFSSGAAMKAKAVGLLYDLSDGELMRAVIAQTEKDKDIKEILRQPMRVH